MSLTKRVRASLRKYREQEKKEKKPVEEKKADVFIPTWRQVRAKITLCDKIEDMEKIRKLPLQHLAEYAGISENTIHRWKKERGFLEWFLSNENFIEEADKGAIRVLKRLEQLAFTEKGSAAVMAA